MTTLALYSPDSLTGMELRKALIDVEPSFQEIVALTSDPEEVGNLIELAGQAVRVGELTEGSLVGVDLVVSCADSYRSNLPLLTALTAEPGNPADLLLTAPDTPFEAASALVPAVNLPEDGCDLPRSMTVPHPAIIVLTRLLRSFEGLGLEGSSSTVLQPASVLGQGAMNEVFGQARSLLVMDGSLPTEHFGFQAAFSSTPSRHAGDDALHRQRMNEILGSEAHDLQTIQTGSFHGVGVSTHLRFKEPVTLDTFDATVSALQADWDALEDDPSTIGRAEADQPGFTAERTEDGRSAWLWLAADNLTHAVTPAITGIVKAWSTARASN